MQSPEEYDRPTDHSLDQPPAPPVEDITQSIGIQFLRELVIFIMGILLGFYWHIYYTESQNEETHIIIGLIVIIICMTRYLFLLKRAQRASRKSEDE